ncbi:hypothetical protein [Scatolibacter rhodanostii]|uniref:hypothetical protein n=1 Tax=Scatolibacter rhodanostii TaxID=2014781 RepID=UPI0013564EC2|nr:hypothetical protein [Scatolibacter rhodanostii]
MKYELSEDEVKFLSLYQELLDEYKLTAKENLESLHELQTRTMKSLLTSIK